VDKVFGGIAKILENSGSSFAVLALVAIIFAFVALLFFRNAEAKQKEKIFIITTGFFLALILVVLAASLFNGSEVTAKELEKDPALTNSNTLGAHVTIDATAGFQNSGIYLKKGEKVILKPEGRIHLASTQLNTFVGLARPLIVQNLDQKEYKNDKDRFKLPPLDEKNIFRRDWIGPDGEKIESDFRLDECKLRKDLNWGTLLVVVMPSEISAKSDPFEVLKDSSLKSADLNPVPGFQKEGFVAKRDGWLTFIVNDAVISPYHSESEVSQDYYKAFNKAANDLIAKGDDRHKIPLSSVPLVWYSDNVGAFRVLVNKVRS
jgi:hypothetical protein